MILLIGAKSISKVFGSLFSPLSYMSLDSVPVSFRIDKALLLILLAGFNKVVNGILKLIENAVP